MARAVTAPPTLDSSPETINGCKLRRLIVDGGTAVLIIIFNKQLKGKSLKEFLKAKKKYLEPLRYKLLTKTQWYQLYPTSHITPDSNKFDISLLSLLLENIPNLIIPPTDGWRKKPNARDTSTGANILRIRYFRNELHAHISETGISTNDFNFHWKKVSSVLVNMGFCQKNIDRLKEEECVEDVVERVMKAWNAMNEEGLQIGHEIRLSVNNIGKGLKGMKRVLKENAVITKDVQGCQQKKSKFSEDIDKVLEKLPKCDFTSERKILCGMFLYETREAILKEVYEWLDDGSSKNRAFIIGGIAGMGKSVIAAVICEDIKQRLAGCHFCSHSNGRYSNPKILLQSIARQMCNVLELSEFKQALIKNLRGVSVETMDIPNLFTTLLKEPLSQIQHPGKNFLIVIDGLDECEDSEARHEFVDLIANHLPELPIFIRIVITTRPEKYIARKFEPFNIYLEKDEKYNKRDVQMFLEEKLSSCCTSVWIKKNITAFTSISNGLMLHAFYLFKYFKENKVLVNLPTGLNDVFQMYFKRLEGNFKKDLKINEDIFLSLLSAMLVAREPLPLDFVCDILGVKTGTISENRSIVNATCCISSLFVIIDDHVNFFHKSVKDWFLCKNKHSYTIDQKHGHKVLAKQCAECFDKMRGTSLVEFTPVNSYALEHGFEHMIQDDDQFVSYLTSYLVDVEILYHHFSFLSYNRSDLDQYTDMVKRNKGYSQVAVETQMKVEKLDEILMRCSVSIHMDPLSFLSCLICETTGTEMSSKALSLFKRIYPELPYFEQVSKHVVPVNKQTIALKEQPFTCADVCIPKDLVVLCFESGVVKLISIKPFKEIWTKTFAKDEISTNCIAFHPDKDVVLPGRLDQVLSLIDGSWQQSPFSCKENDRCYFFTDCCFSPDNTFMIAHDKRHAYYLHVWNLVSGEKVRHILEHGIVSFRFSRNGNYLAVLIGRGECSVYDVRNNYKCLRTATIGENLNVIFTTWKSDSWVLLDIAWLEIQYNGGKACVQSAN